MAIDTTKLRELAQKAHQGPWKAGSLESWSADGLPCRFVYRGQDESVQTRVRINGGEGVNGSVFDCDADAEYIAAANPATVLALLDEIKNSRAILKSYSKVLVEISESLDIAPFHFTTPVAVDRCRRLIAIEKAARNLAKVKGRHNSEQAMNQLLEALK